MLLRSLTSLLDKNLVVLTGDLTPEELFYQSPLSNSYYFVAISGSDFRLGNYSGTRICNLTSLDEEEDSAPDTDIIFEFAGRKVHLDFDEILPEDVFVQITFGRNLNENSVNSYPFTVQFEYI